MITAESSYPQTWAVAEGGHYEASISSSGYAEGFY